MKNLEQCLNVKNVSRKDCENCSKFSSRYIEYPITVNGIESEEIKPCGEEYENKSYLGIYLGELPISISASYDEDTGILRNRAVNNPAIFVPELKRIIYGYESWWREIESAEDVKGISDEDEDIENTWYVGLLKKLKE